MKKRVLLIGLLALLVACGQQSTNSTPAAMPESASSMGRAMPKMMADTPGGAEQSLTEISEPAAEVNPVKKYIALRHHLQVETPAEKMQTAFDAALKHCEALKCQLLSAYYNKETPYSPPSASLSARVPPRNVAIFLSGLAKNG